MGALFFKIVPGIKIALPRADKSNCHKLKLLYLELGRAWTASMPAALRLYCIVTARDLLILAFVFGPCRWSAIFGRLLVVYLANCKFMLTCARFPANPLWPVMLQASTEVTLPGRGGQHLLRKRDFSLCNKIDFSQYAKRYKDSK
jgi:hypothetical protein